MRRRFWSRRNVAVVILALVVVAFVSPIAFPEDGRIVLGVIGGVAMVVSVIVWQMRGEFSRSAWRRREATTARCKLCGEVVGGGVEAAGTEAGGRRCPECGRMFSRPTA